MRVHVDSRGQPWTLFFRCCLPFEKYLFTFFTILCVHFGAGVACSMCGVMAEIYFFTILCVHWGGCIGMCGVMAETEKVVQTLLLWAGVRGSCEAPWLLRMEISCSWPVTLSLGYPVFSEAGTLTGASRLSMRLGCLPRGLKICLPPLPNCWDYKS